MRLQRHLLTRIILAALLCLLATAGYTLYQAHRQAGELTRQTAESIVKQLRQQLLLTEAGIGRSEPFPDFDAWKQSGGQPGMCISYTGKATQQTHSICNGEKWLTPDWPDGFALLYRRLFPDQQVITQTVQFNGREYGVLTVAGSAETEIAGAWRAVSGLLQLSAITIFAVCLLVTLTIRRALRPVTAIVAGVGRMEAAQPDYRLPFFELYEWQCIAAAINRLTARQQQLLAERQQLIAKLLQIQEDERRHLSRELHDELGQCLVAIQAVAASIKQSAAEKNPEIAAEAEHIGRITRHALDGARHLLMRLRPPELDELGLAASLKRLVLTWSRHAKEQTVYQLRINGDCRALTDLQSVAIFRIVQECLTNIARHASAASAAVELTITAQTAVLSIEDDGVLTQLPVISGVGLLGIRERVAGLQGEFKLSIIEPHGLSVEIRLPLAAPAEPELCGAPR